IEMRAVHARDTRRAERHQQPALGRKLHDGVALPRLAVFGRDADAVRDPDVSVTVDGYAMRTDEHLGAERHYRGAARIVFRDRIDVGILAGVAAAAVEHPHALAVAVERQTGGRAEIAAH